MRHSPNADCTPMATPEHYIYRIDHDEGFAPNPDHGSCTLCGCKVNTIEAWAQPGSWVIGVGGNGTGKPNKLIYAMKVEHVLSRAEFKAKYRKKGKYLNKTKKAAANVLFSRKFYYFGDNAIDLPKKLRHILIRGRGCKCVPAEAIVKLSPYLSSRYSYGKKGRPNNPLNETRLPC